MSIRNFVSVITGTMITIFLVTLGVIFGEGSTTVKDFFIAGGIIITFYSIIPAFLATPKKYEKPVEPTTAEIFDDGKTEEELVRVEQYSLEAEGLGTPIRTKSKNLVTKGPIKTSFSEKKDSQK